MSYRTGMNYMHDRLRKARIDAGYRSAAAAARAHGWNEATYRHHENGTRGFDSDHSRSYAQAYGVRASWLVGWEDISTREEFKTLDLPNIAHANLYMNATDEESAAEKELSKRLNITLIPHGNMVRTGDIAVTSFLSHGDERVAYPTALLERLAKVSPRHLFSLSVEGSSMAPTIRDGAYVMIDGARTVVDTHDELWLIWQGRAPMIRRVRVSTDESLTLLADDGRTPPQIIPKEAFDVEGIGEVDILGKVVWISQTP